MNSILRLTLLVVCFSTIVSCKDDQVFGDITPNTTRVIAEFTDAKEGTAVTHDFANGFVELELTELRLNPRSVTDHDAKVKIILKPSVVAEYNTANGTVYQVPSAGIFSLVDEEVVLTRAERKKMIRAKVLPSGFVTSSFAVGLSIAEMIGGEINPIAHDVVVFISIKNDFDGIYRAKGYSNIPTTTYVGSFSLPCDEELGVVTSGNNAVYLDPAQPVANGGAFTYITNLLPEFVINKTSFKVTAVNARAGSLSLIYPYDAAYDSRYDPSNKTIYVKYGIGPAGSGRYIIDTLVYCRPR